MELKSSKIKLLALVLHTILLLPGGSEATPIFASQRDYCGKTAVNDTGPGRTRVLRKLPWVVGVEAHEEGKNRTCTGAVFTPRLVLTSILCAPHDAVNARYVIHYGFDRQNLVTKAHWIQDTAFIVLEVSRPFKADFAICLAHVLSGAGLNDTVWTASRVDLHGTFVPGSLRQEQWSLVHTSPFCEDACKNLGERCLCAISDVDGGRTCRGNEGKVVMRWDGHNWYLFGMVTDVKHGERCMSEGGRDRSFQWIHPSDSATIKEIVELNKPYYLPKPEEDIETETCGQYRKLHLGAWKEVAPFLLPWIVAVRATLGAQIVHCAGTITDAFNVITAEDCYPKGFEDATYTVIVNSIYLAVGREVPVRQIIRNSTDFEPSLILLVLSHQIDPHARICSTCAPFRHSGEQVVAASWAFSDVGGRLVNQLYYEEWTLPSAPSLCDGEHFDNKGPGNQTLLCAVAQTDTHYVCRGDLGTPVMYWSQGKWCLLGVITHVDVPGQEECVLKKTRKRIFQLTKIKSPPAEPVPIPPSQEQDQLLPFRKTTPHDHSE